LTFAEPDGAPLEELPAVSERLGHSSVMVTATVYSHRLTGRDQEAANR
jgi:integrase